MAGCGGGSDTPGPVVVGPSTSDPDPIDPNLQTTITNQTQPATTQKKQGFSVVSNYSEAQIQVQIDGTGWFTITGTGSGTQYLTPDLSLGFHIIQFRSRHPTTGGVDPTPATRVVNVSYRRIPYRGTETHITRFLDASRVAPDKPAIDQRVGWAQNLGANLVRFDCVKGGSWPPESPPFALDYCIQRVESIGAKPLLCIQDGSSNATYVDAPGFARFCGNIATLYQDRVIYEVLNEPNLQSTTFMNIPNSEKPQRAADYGVAAYNAIKTAAPVSTVIGPTMAQADTPWLGLYLSALGSRQAWDEFSYHPYTDGRRPDDSNPHPLLLCRFVQGMQAMRTSLVNSGRDVPFWLTEIGWSDGLTDSLNRNVTANEAGVCLSMMFDSAVFLDTSGLKIKGISQYDLYEDWDTPDNWEGHLGVIKNPQGTVKEPQWTNLKAGVARDAPFTAPPPDTTIIGGPAEGSTTTNTAPGFAFHSTDPVGNFEVAIDSFNFVFAGTAGGDGNIFYVPPKLSAGSHTLLVRSYNSAGRDPSPATRKFTVQVVTSPTDQPATLVFSDEFNATVGSAPDSTKWSVYNSIGNANFGLRRPSAFAQGIDPVTGINCMVITAQMVSGSLVSGGMAMKPGALSGSSYGMTYGRYEVRMRVEDDPSFAMSGLSLTWPDSGVWPDDGENDYYETGHGDNPKLIKSFIHQPSPAGGTTQKAHTWSGLLARDWHVFRLDWTPNAMIWTIDGVVQTAFQVTDATYIPDVNHHITLQLDAFANTMTGVVRQFIDYARVWRYT